MLYPHDKASFARKGRAGRVLLCLAVLGLWELCFVQGWPVPKKDKILTSKIQCCMRERRRMVPPESAPGEREMKIITSKIKGSQTASELLDYVDSVIDRLIFNYIHVAAAYTKLGSFKKKGQLYNACSRRSVGSAGESAPRNAGERKHRRYPTSFGHLPICSRTSQLC